MSYQIYMVVIWWPLPECPKLGGYDHGILSQEDTGWSSRITQKTATVHKYLGGSDHHIERQSKFYFARMYILYIVVCCLLLSKHLRHKGSTPCSVMAAVIPWHSKGSHGTLVWPQYKGYYRWWNLYEHDFHYIVWITCYELHIGYVSDVTKYC